MFWRRLLRLPGLLGLLRLGRRLGLLLGRAFYVVLVLVLQAIETPSSSTSQIEMFTPSMSCLAQYFHALMLMT